MRTVSAAVTSLGMAAALLAAIPAFAVTHVLQNDKFSGGFVNPQNSAFLCFQDETYASEFDIPVEWFPIKVLKIETAFLANPLDAMTGGTGTPCGRFRVAVWRGSGSTDPASPVMWDSVDKFQKDWDIPGDNQIHTLDLEKTLPGGNASCPTITALGTSGKNQGRIRIGLRADNAMCSDGKGNGSYPGMAVDGLSIVPQSNWGYGWAVMLGCDSGKSGSPFWTTAEQFGIKGNYIFRVTVEGSDDGTVTPDATGSTDQDSGGFWDDGSGSTDLDTGSTSGTDSGSTITDTGVAVDTGGSSSDTGQKCLGKLCLFSIQPTCIPPPTIDTKVYLYGAGFAAGAMTASVNGKDAPVHVNSDSEAYMLITAKSLAIGAYTVTIKVGGDTDFKAGDEGLHVDNKCPDPVTTSDASGSNDGTGAKDVKLLLNTGSGSGGTTPSGCTASRTSAFGGLGGLLLCSCIALGWRRRAQR